MYEVHYIPHLSRLEVWRRTSRGKTCYAKIDTDTGESLMPTAVDLKWYKPSKYKPPVTNITLMQSHRARLADQIKPLDLS